MNRLIIQFIPIFAILLCCGCRQEIVIEITLEYPDTDQYPSAVYTVQTCRSFRAKVESSKKSLAELIEAKNFQLDLSGLDFSVSNIKAVETLKGDQKGINFDENYSERTSASFDLLMLRSSYAIDDKNYDLAERLIFQAISLDQTKSSTLDYIYLLDRANVDITLIVYLVAKLVQANPLSVEQIQNSPEWRSLQKWDTGAEFSKFLRTRIAYTYNKYCSGEPESDLSKKLLSIHSHYTDSNGKFDENISLEESKWLGKSSDDYLNNQQGAYISFMMVQIRIALLDAYLRVIKSTQIDKKMLTKEYELPEYFVDNHGQSIFHIKKPLPSVFYICSDTIYGKYILSTGGTLPVRWSLGEE